MKKTIFAAALILITGVSLQTVKNYQNNKLEAAQAEISSTQNSQLNENQGAGIPLQNNSGLKSNLIKFSAIDFKLKDLNGKEVSLSQYKGKKVFLNFWATWCPPCRGEMPDIEKLYNENKDSDLVILAVNLSEKSDTVKAFMDKNKYHFPVLLDSTGEIAGKYNISSIPTSYFIDKDGNILSTHIGAMDQSQMEVYIRNLEKK